MMAGRLERRVLLGFAAALVLMAASAGYTWHVGIDVSHSIELFERSQSARQAARRLYAAIAGAEAAQRAFLLSGADQFRDAYLRQVREVARLQKKIGDLAGTGATTRESHAALRALVAQKLDELAAQAAAYEATRGAPIALTSPALLDSIYAASERIAGAEEAWLAQRVASAARGPAVTLMGFLAAMALATGVLVVLFRSIRAEVRARAAADRSLHEANQFLDSIVENIPDMIFVKDAQTLAFVRVNRAFETLLERERRDVIGKRDSDLLPRDIADFYNANDRAVLASGEVLDIPEERLQTASRGERIVHTKKIPIRDDSGRPRYVLGISEDVTERARNAAEIRALAAALERRARDVEAVNRELETFAYSVSHDLRAPLRHISGYVQLLSQSLEGRLDPSSQRYIGVISDAAAQMGRLIDDLLAFSRMSRLDLTSGSVAPRAVVDAAIAGLEMETRGRDIEWRISDLPRVEADPALLRIVYTNLIGNAVKYSAPREHAVIEIGAEGEDDGRAVLYVRDNGVGFDMAYAERLFGIFQRLHGADEFEGTGIGLATVQRIIARHGGRVWAHAAPGEGATFYFTLAQPA